MLSAQRYRAAHPVDGEVRGHICRTSCRLTVEMNKAFPYCSIFYVSGPEHRQRRTDQDMMRQLRRQKTMGDEISCELPRGIATHSWRPTRREGATSGKETGYCRLLRTRREELIRPPHGEAAPLPPPPPPAPARSVRSPKTAALPHICIIYAAFAATL